MSPWYATQIQAMTTELQSLDYAWDHAQLLRDKDMIEKRRKVCRSSITRCREMIAQNVAMGI